MRQQIEQLEDDLRSERSKIRNLQREIDDLTEANETLIRDNGALRSTNKRTTLSVNNTRRQYGSSSTIAGRNNGSSDNLNRTEDNESVGTDGKFFYDFLKSFSFNTKNFI